MFVLLFPPPRWAGAAGVGQRGSSGRQAVEEHPGSAQDPRGRLAQAEQVVGQTLTSQPSCTHSTVRTVTLRTLLYVLSLYILDCHCMYGTVLYVWSLYVLYFHYTYCTVTVLYVLVCHCT